MTEDELKRPIVLVDAPAWTEEVRCKSKRGPRSMVRCEVHEGHNDSHAGRGKSGRWFTW